MTNEKSTFFFIFLSYLTSTGCIDPVKFDKDQYQSKIVIDGSISNAPGPYQVFVYGSKPFTEDGETELISLSKISIIDENGNLSNLREISTGRYETDSSAIRGEIGKSYFLKIKTADGREYQSKPERISPPVPIDTYNVTYSTVVTNPKPFKLSILTKDPIEKGNYYKWKWTHYDTTTACKTVVKATFGARLNIINPCCEKCWRFDPCNSCLFIASDALINGKNITTEVGDIPYEEPRKPYFMVLEQYSISKEHYEFWKIAQTQINNSGGIFDNSPAQVQGNIYNPNDSTDSALGYFSASGVNQKSVFFIRDRIEYPKRLSSGIVTSTQILNKCLPCGEALRTTRQPVGWKE